MSPRPCPREDEVLQALRRGELGGEAEAHAAACPACTQALHVARQLQSLADHTHPRGPLPTAAQIWWRAQVIHRLTRESRAAERAERPARWGLAAGLALGTAGLATFLGSQLADLLRSALSTPLDAAATAPLSTGLAPILALLATPLLAGLATLALLRHRA